MTLSEFCCNVYLVYRSTGRKYQEQLITSARVFEAWALEKFGVLPQFGQVPEGKTAAEAPGIITDWLASLWIAEREKSVSARTAKNSRDHLRSLLLAAADEGLCNAPKRLRKVRVPQHIVTAFSPEDVRKLAAAAGEVKGYFPANGIPRGPYLQSVVSAAWDSGLRRGDLVNGLKLDDVQQDGMFIIVAHKSGKRKVGRLHEATIEIIRKMFPPHGPDRELIWPWEGSHASLEDLMRSVGKKAGVEGSFQKIRRGSGCAVEAANPGFGHHHLGNLRQTFEQYYDDPRQSRPTILRPQSLFGRDQDGEEKGGVA